MGWRRCVPQPRRRCRSASGSTVVYLRNRPPLLYPVAGGPFRAVQPGGAAPHCRRHSAARLQPAHPTPWRLWGEEPGFLNETFSAAARTVVEPSDYNRRRCCRCRGATSSAGPWGAQSQVGGQGTVSVLHCIRFDGAVRSAWCPPPPTCPPIACWAPSQHGPGSKVMMPLLGSVL